MDSGHLIWRYPILIIYPVLLDNSRWLRCTVKCQEGLSFSFAAEKESDWLTSSVRTKAERGRNRKACLVLKTAMQQTDLTERWRVRERKITRNTKTGNTRLLGLTRYRWENEWYLAEEMGLWWSDEQTENWWMDHCITGRWDNGQREGSVDRWMCEHNAWRMDRSWLDRQMSLVMDGWMDEEMDSLMY